MAQGSAKDAGSITASGDGSFAGGLAETNNITASTHGAFAFGNANTDDVIASSINAVQFGPGTNAIADSLRVGEGIRLIGKVETPGVLANGDIWLDSDGYVKIRSNGATVSIS